MTKHEITNDFALDAIKDNFKPPSMEQIGEDSAKELFERLGIKWEVFFDYVYSNSEYEIDNGKNFYNIKDVAKIIKDKI